MYEYHLFELRDDEINAEMIIKVKYITYTVEKWRPEKIQVS